MPAAQNVPVAPEKRSLNVKVTKEVERLAGQAKHCLKLSQALFQHCTSAEPWPNS